MDLPTISRFPEVETENIRGHYYNLYQKEVKNTNEVVEALKQQQVATEKEIDKYQEAILQFEKTHKSSQDAKSNLFTYTCTFFLVIFSSCFVLPIVFMFFAMVCSALTCSSVDEEAYGYGGMVTGVIFWVISFLAAMSNQSGLSRTNEENTVLLSKKKRELQEIQDKIQQEEQRIKQISANLKAESIKLAKEYSALFEKSVMKRSQEMTQSESAKKIIPWVSNGFSRTINASDRAKHIQKISVPFDIQVYSERIVCNIGEFDYKTECHKILKTNIDQTAVARVIATAVQIEMTMKYPKDASGTVPVIDTSYQGQSNFALAKLCYHAKNGNFVEAQDW